MTDEPIFDRLEETWSNVVHRFQHHHDTAATVAAAPTRKATPMSSFAEIVDRWKADFENLVSDTKTKLEQDLPVVANYAQAAATNPLVDAALSVVHLSPDFLAAAATALRDADAKLEAAAQAQAAAQAAQDAALAAANPPEAPAEPAAEAPVA